MPDIEGRGLETRRAFNALIDALARAGDAAGARAAAELAVARGLWRRPDQRPLHFVPDLPALPVHAAAGFYLARYLDRHARTIREEALAILGEAGEGLSPVEEPLVGAGAWDLAVFYEGGIRNARTSTRFPRTAAIVEAAPEEIRQAGVVMFSWLHPGTHIIPHCGFSNARLRLHLPLRVAEGAYMRVSDETVTWTEGRSVVFDDSFEHEVWHEGDSPRIVLLIDLFHPALGEAERRDFLTRFSAYPLKGAGDFLRGAGLEFVALDGNDSMRVRFCPEQDRRIRRHMAESGVRAIRLDAAGAVIVEKEEAPS